MLLGFKEILGNSLVPQEIPWNIPSIPYLPWKNPEMSEWKAKKYGWEVRFLE